MKNNIIAGVALLALLAPSFALAHEHQVFTIGGKSYEFVVGSLGEPLVVDDKTGVDLRVSQGGVAVEGLEKDLKVELIAGDKKKTLDMTTVYGTKGSYKAIFFPTIQTTLTYRIFGKINNTPVDLSFTCNPAGHVAEPDDKTAVPVSEGVVRTLKSGQFGCPMDKAELGFPEESMTSVELHKDAEHHMSALSTAIENDMQKKIGLGLGLLGVILGGFALFKSRASRL